MQIHYLSRGPRPSLSPSRLTPPTGVSVQCTAHIAVNSTCKYTSTNNALLYQYEQRLNFTLVAVGASGATICCCKCTDACQCVEMTVSAISHH
jgi:hypothetical protein